MQNGNEWLMLGVAVFCTLMGYFIARTISWNAKQDELAKAYREGYFESQIETFKERLK